MHTRTLKWTLTPAELEAQCWAGGPACLEKVGFAVHDPAAEACVLVGPLAAGQP